jgi:hypothetical protein
MNTRDTYRAELEAKIVGFGNTLEEIRTKAEMRRQNAPDIDIDALFQKHKKAKAKAGELESADESVLQKIKSDLDTLLDDIDNDLRQALNQLGG